MSIFLTDYKTQDMELHQSAILHLLVKMGLKQGADNAFAINSDATMDDDIIPSQAKEIHLILSKYIKFPDDEYEVTFTGDGDQGIDDEEVDDED